MKKLVIGMLFVMALSSTDVFAQLQNSARTARNLKNLDRVVARATKGSTLGRPVVTQLPPNIVPGNAVGLLRVKPSTTVTPVTRSYHAYLRLKAFKELTASAYLSPDICSPEVTRSLLFPLSSPETLALNVPNEWIGNDVKHVFYEDQTKLARDLNAFYKGNAELRVGPDDRLVRLYALPVDGILYKPAGYDMPLVLNSNEYFVIYDVAAQTGKIADNVPAVYNSFKLVGKAGGSDGQIKPNQPTKAPNLAKEGSNAQNAGRTPREEYEYYRALYTNNPGAVKTWESKNYASQFTSEEELVKAVASFHRGNASAKVKELVTGQVFNVYELPKSLIYAPQGFAAIDLTPLEDVVVYSKEYKGGNVVDRVILEDDRFFEFVK